MSIGSLKGFCLPFGRKAYLLAHTNNRIYFPPTGSIAYYSSENNLYLMVKKRTLEARTKLQHNKLPKNKDCVSSSDLKTKSTSSTSNARSSYPTKTQEKQSDVCQNTQILRATSVQHTQKKQSIPKCELPPAHKFQPPIKGADVISGPSNIVDKEGKKKFADKTEQICNMSKKETTPKCPSEGSGGGGGSNKGSHSDPCSRKTDNRGSNDGMKNFILYASAALAGGGFLYWLFSKTRKHGSEKSTKSMDSGPHNIPLTSSLIPKHVPYLLIGAGTAAFSAFRAIKSNEPSAKILMITNEHRRPYMRPPLSKELWYTASSKDVDKEYRFKQWTGAERSLYFEPKEFFASPEKLLELPNGGLAVAQGYTVKKIDPKKHIVTLTDGYEISYDECLIATGCNPKNLSVFTNAPQSVREKVMVYRTPEDFERLKRYIDEKRSITIIGSGFIGSELACSLANYSREKGTKICQVYQETGNMSKVLPDYLSKWTTKKVEAMGVCVYANARVREVHRDESSLKLILNNGTTLLTDIVVVCVGCTPNTNIASLSGLEVDRNHGGFLVNAELEARRNLFVAGDASCFYDPLLGRRRVEHHDHSVVSGRLAGENMVGKKKPYTHQSMFWSDLGPEIGYEAIGLIDASLPTVGVFALPAKADRRTDNLVGTESTGEYVKETKDVPEVKCNTDDAENYGRGVIFYLRDNKIVGILLWNLFNRIGLARTVITQNKQYDDLNEVAKLFEIHS